TADSRRDEPDGSHRTAARAPRGIGLPERALARCGAVRLLRGCLEIEPVRKLLARCDHRLPGELAPIGCRGRDRVRPGAEAKRQLPALENVGLRRDVRAGTRVEELELGFRRRDPHDRAVAGNEEHLALERSTLRRIDFIAPLLEVTLITVVRLAVPFELERREPEVAQHLPAPALLV